MTEASKDPPSPSPKDVVDATEEKNDTVIESSDVDDETEIFATSPPSMTISLVVYWIIPLVVLGLMSRIGHEPMEVPTFKNTKSRPIVIPKTSPSPSPPSTMQQQQQQMYLQQQQQQQQQRHQQQRQPSASPHRKPTATPVTQAPSKMPSSYREVVDEINGRRRKNVFKERNSDSATPPQQQTQPTQTRPPTATTSADTTAAKRTVSPPSPQAPAHEPPANPERKAVDELVSRTREEYMNNPSNVYKMIEYADAMRQRDLVVHDGGSMQAEAIHMYENIVTILRNDRRRAKEKGEATDILKGGQAASSVIQSVNDEVYLPYNQKSLDGTLVAVLVAKGKQYFMANMFEKAVESYQDALEIAPAYLDALGSKASAQIILGQFQEAAEAYLKVMELDNQEDPVFTDTFTGLAKILSAKEDVVEGGWEKVVTRIEQLMPSLEEKRKVAPSNKHVADTLARMHNALFTYHDASTKDTAKAWNHLKSGFTHKMAMLEPWNALFEKKKVAMVKNIFKQGFWPDGVGLIEDKTPIFIIGFPRSGSTLLERVLDSHSQVVGTGEDSVFNGRLEQIRNQIVKASMTGSVDMIRSVVDHEAKEVLKETQVRWESIEKTKKKTSTTGFTTIDEKPQRFTDKMLTNYFNIGFIHMLFPNALILHVARNPMDVLFSSYKHEFPAGTLDYTSEFGPLSDLYLSYREIIEHWDAVLPGRVTHVRYEDMVNDMPGMAKAIIASTGLEWEEGVLDFHKKKHAVNTHSTTQVRKGIYKTAVEAWRRYEEPLQPLMKLVGDKVDWDLKTSLPSYSPPVTVDAK